MTLALESPVPKIRPARAPRFDVHPGLQIRLATTADGGELVGLVEQLSSSGAVVAYEALRALQVGAILGAALSHSELSHECGHVTVVRRIHAKDSSGQAQRVAIAFAQNTPEVITKFGPSLARPRSVTEEARREDAVTRRPSHSYIDEFYAHPSADLFAKCDRFRTWVDDMGERGLFQRVFRVTTTGPMRPRTTVYDSVQRRERPILAYDSNSYLCLHEHPRVIERVGSVLTQVGYGSPSAQLLGGTNRYLRELEDALSAFHGREDTIVFPTGYAANTGVVSALVRSNDALLRDRFAHASLHDACKSSQAKFNHVFRHNDVASAEALLQKADESGCDGKLMVTDGVFSMHGRVAPLPQLVELARKYGAKLLVDDAHGVGVIGASGGGIEEHFGMPGSVDVLMGTLSKSIGALGGYISGSRNLTNYLRFFAPSSMFTTAPPAAMCAGMVEALRIIRDEPEHHQRLWHNIHRFVPALKAAGFIVPEPESPIVTVFLGVDNLMYEFSRELFDAGIKCSSVAYPAVPKDQSILRLVLTSKHTDEDLDATVAMLSALGRKYGILHFAPQGVVAVGKRLTIQP